MVCQTGCVYRPRTCAQSGAPVSSVSLVEVYNGYVGRFLGFRSHPHPRVYLCTVVMGHLVFNTANESQKLMLRGPRSFIFSSF